MYIERTNDINQWKKTRYLWRLLASLIANTDPNIVVRAHYHARNNVKELAHIASTLCVSTYPSYRTSSKWNVQTRLCRAQSVEWQ